MTLLDLAIGVLWAALAAFASAIIFTAYWTLKSSKVWLWRSFSEFRSGLKWLLRSGYDKAFIKFTHKPSNRFIRFEKYIRIGQYGIALVVPNDWSDDDIDRLTRWCDTNGLRVDPIDANEETAATALQVDCGNDTERAYALAREIWFNIFGLADNAKYQYDHHDILRFDELVDSPDFPRFTEEEIAKRSLEESRRRLGNLKRRDNPFGMPNYIIRIFLGVSFFASVVSMIGLPIATLGSTGEPPDWILTVGTIRFTGASSSLVWFVIYAISVPATFLLRRNDNGNGQVPQDYLHLVMRPITLAMPTAVVTVWIGG